MRSSYCPNIYSIPFNLIVSYQLLFCVRSSKDLRKTKLLLWMKVFNNRNCGKHVESHNTYKQCLILVQVGAEVDVFSNELLPQEDHVPLFTKRNKCCCIISVKNYLIKKQK